MTTSVLTAAGAAAFAVFGGFAFAYALKTVAPVGILVIVLYFVAVVCWSHLACRGNGNGSGPQPKPPGLA